MMGLELRFQLEGGAPGAKPQNQMPLNVQSALLINLILPNYVGVKKKPDKQKKSHKNSFIYFQQGTVWLESF